MIVAEKPELNEDLLAHFGVKGMHWGQRKARSSSGSEGSPPTKRRMSTGRKVALGVAVAGGAAAAAFILSRRGRTSTNALQNLESAAARLRRDPSPFEMRMAAGMAAQRNVMQRAGSQHLTGKTWRDAANMSKMARSTAGPTSLDEVRKALLNPKHVWRI